MDIKPRKGECWWAIMERDPSQQSMQQTVLLMAQLTGRQRAWQTAQ